MTTFEAVLVEKFGRKGLTTKLDGEQTKEVIRETCSREYRGVAYPNDLHYAGIFWIDCFGMLSHKVAYYESFDDAKDVSEYLFNNCTLHNGEDVKLFVVVDNECIANSIF